MENKGKEKYFLLYYRYIYTHRNGDERDGRISGFETKIIPPFRVMLKAFDPERLNKSFGFDLIEGCATRKYCEDVRAIFILPGYEIVLRTGKDVVDVVV